MQYRDVNIQPWLDMGAAGAIMRPRADGNEPSSPDQIIGEIQAAFEAHHDQVVELVDDVREIRNGLDGQARTLARLTVGGGHPANSLSVNRLEAFNALLRQRHGDGAPQLQPREWGDYNVALGEYFRRGNAALDHHDVRAALSVGSDPAGGYLTISDMDPEPRERLFRTSPMRALASAITLASGSFEGVYEVDDFSFGWVGENETRDETGDGTLAAFRIDADEPFALVSVTQRLLDDAAIDVGQYIESRMSRRFTRGENAGFVTGDGFKKPRGFLDYKAAAVTDADGTRDWGKLQYVVTGAAGGFPALSGVPGASDPNALYDVKAALHAELRADAVWGMNSTTFATVEKLKDGDGRSLIRQSLDVATPDRLLGFPVAIMEDMPDPAADSFSIAFGNFGVGYQIVDKPGVRILRDPYTTKGKVKFYGYKRVGGDVVNFDAIKLLKFAAS